MKTVKNTLWINNGRFSCKIGKDYLLCIPSISFRRAKKLAKKKRLFLKGGIKKAHPKWTDYTTKMSYNRSRKVLWINHTRCIMNIWKPSDTHLEELTEELGDNFKYRCYFN